ncbi:LexA/Signal peptidase [Ophiobolus disseminans]|uniref:Mitochondrial inner membrane protease subunit n=1 Tax=Ophiobolus disseminans TaxID=1469910 RepID=A0A6A6ZDR4_9PLEO|nr:LexA/Signal peptidase [Ophiobolus disseminans]
MPPKPPIRIPKTSAPVARTRFAPPPPTKSTPRTPTRSQPSHPTPPPPRTPWYGTRPIRSGLIWTANTVAMGCALLWVRDHHVDVLSIKGVSMAPTVNPELHETGKKDWVIVRPYAQSGHGRGVERGDVVTFWKTHKPEECGIKRVVGLEGDTVYVKRGYALDKQEGKLGGMPDGLGSLDPDAVDGRMEEVGKVVVPYGHVWVEGDNSRFTLDSRDYGPMSKGLLMGRVVWIWRGWGEWVRMGDERGKKEKARASRVVEGRAELPAVFLE